MKLLGPTLLAGIVTAGVALSAPSFAAPRHGGDKPQACEAGRFPGPHHFDHEMGGPPLLRDPSLSEEQRDAIFKIHHAHAPAQWKAARALARLRAEREALLRADNYDPAKGDELIARESEAYAAMLRERTATAREVSAVLTPEQRTRLRNREAEGPQPGQGPGRHPR
ncbi:periplasmic heavy metal sensor [Zoogloea sp.]|uniref:Spy/CpxP family protein refolding chaperone n=1 Tax=Zoogloea sp. TaxID=49181 RepID=UPI001415DEF2|nr:MAG: periplasmic heavy metal sensor [Zoogloea sp.]